MKHLALATWVCAVGDPHRLPADHGAEVAFIGRSNAGKSSAINAITGRKGLAFVSKAPGRTQSINFFSWGSGCRLVDLPGYGYAAVPQQVMRGWDELISTYLQNRGSLRGLVLVMDSRRPLTAHDRYVLGWAAPLKCPVLILLTKCDKLTRSEAMQTQAATRAELDTEYPGGAIQLFSARTGTGVVAARGIIIRWLGRGQKNPPVKGE